MLVPYGVVRTIDVKKRFFMFFLFWSHFLIFQTFFIFKKRWQNSHGHQINKKHFHNNSNEIDL